jgi:hypothetical protein
MNTVYSQGEVRAACPNSTFTLGVALGCSKRISAGAGCLITIVSDDMIKKAGMCRSTSSAMRSHTAMGGLRITAARCRFVDWAE